MARVNNLKESFSNARSILTGMSNDFYIMTDYISENIEDSLGPRGMMAVAIGVFADLTGEEDRGLGGEMPEIMKERKGIIIQELQWLPQFIELIADEDFTEDIKWMWKDCFKYTPPKKMMTDSIKTSCEYPEYIISAVDWWANAITAPKFDNGEDMPMIVLYLTSGRVKKYTPDEIKIFKDSLAEEIKNKLEEDGSCIIEVEWDEPCDILHEAGKMIGVPAQIGYPWDTQMKIDAKNVSVSAGKGASWEVLWQLGE